MKKVSQAKKKTTTKSNDDSSIRDMIFQFIGNFAGTFFEQLQENAMSKVREVLREVKKTATITFLILFGIMLLFIGLANIIDVAVGMKGAGFLFIGFVVMFFGMLLNIFTRRTS